MVECIETSAPSSSGRWSTGVPHVLSTAQIAPPRCAISATAAMSTTCSSGFDGVSIQTSFVFGRIAAFTFARCVMSTADTSIPHGPKTSRASLVVPKYASSGSDDVRARSERLEQRHRRGGAGRERRRRRAALELRQASLERGAIGILVARVEDTRRDSCRRPLARTSWRDGSAASRRRSRDRRRGRRERRGSRCALSGKREAGSGEAGTTTDQGLGTGR